MLNWRVLTILFSPLAGLIDPELRFNFLFIQSLHQDLPIPTQVHSLINHLERDRRSPLRWLPTVLHNNHLALCFLGRPSPSCNFLSLAATLTFDRTAPFFFKAPRNPILSNDLVLSLPGKPYKHNHESYRASDYHSSEHLKITHCKDYVQILWVWLVNSFLRIFFG